MASPSVLNAPFPSTPIADATGNLSPAWRSYLLSLYVRTGGTTGVNSSTVVTSVTTEAAARQAADTALGGEITTEAAARAAADAAEAATRATADTALAKQIAALVGASSQPGLPGDPGPPGPQGPPGPPGGSSVSMLNRWWFGR